MKKKKEPRKGLSKEKRIALKIFLCSAYLIVITILAVCSYKIYQNKEDVKSWSEVSSANEYSYIKITKMSEKFAYYSTSKKSIHFVIEEEDTGVWHTYLIAIKDSDYHKYKDIIDYTYEKTNKKPKPSKVYGYPVVINDELKNMALANIKNFLPVENEVEITPENFNDYLTNSYLDTTIRREENFDTVLFVMLLLILIMIILFIVTIYDKDKSNFTLEDFKLELRRKKTNPKETENNLI